MNAEYIPLKDLHIRDPFWDRYLKLVTEEIIPYQYDSLCDRIPNAPPSRCIRNLRIAAGLEDGKFEGFVFQDTDLAKWLEAVAYSLTRQPDPALEQTADEMIALIGKAQCPNGYLNSYFTTLHPGKQFCNLKEGHELYTAGHFIEAAVAYYQATGKDVFLKQMCRFADLICQVFRQEDYAGAVPGHEEIELALFRLWEVTGNDDYRQMAYEFVNRRGVDDYLATEQKRERYIPVWRGAGPYLPEYAQAQAPVRQQKTAEGHAVRAMYLFSAMADLAGSFHDRELLAACEGLYANIVEKRMFITGSVGSSGTLERFTSDYDLPNDSNYSESCASVGLAMFCKRMARVTGEAKYFDTAELALYNTILASVSMDGKRFFYVNPLEVIPADCLPATDRAHVQPERQKWFGCACCPPNIARTLASVGEYLFFADPEGVRMNLFVSGSYRLRLGAAEVTAQVVSEFPHAGAVTIRLHSQKDMGGSFRIRVPEYAESPTFLVDGTQIVPERERGYAVIPAHGTDMEIAYHFDMPPRLIYANPRVSASVGKCAVKRGPVVYCLEEADNGDNLCGLQIDPSGALQEHWDASLFGGVNVVEAAGWHLHWDGGLYSTRPATREPVTLRFVPYANWGNRGLGEMAVWVRAAQ